MQVFQKQRVLAGHIQTLSNLNQTVGFVPTMGALHEGHLSLIRESMKNNDQTVVSIFVNPTQFNNPEDLAKYPRTFESDLEKIKSVSDQIIIYQPTVEDLYEGIPVSRHFEFDGLEKQMEGKFRPGHFDGVATVVKRLFDIVKPVNAYFGEKDFQQLQIIRKMVEKLDLAVKIVACPIYREENGLAMSSRNERLTTDEKVKAAIIYKTLLKAQKMFLSGESARDVSAFVLEVFKNNPDFELEYFEIAEEDTLLPCLMKNKDKKQRAFIAVYVNKIRLIDTISFN